MVDGADLGCNVSYEKPSVGIPLNLVTASLFMFCLREILGSGNLKGKTNC